MIEKQQSLAAAIAPLFVCAYNPAAAGSNPKHTIYAFSICIIEIVTKSCSNKGKKGSKGITLNVCSMILKRHL